MVTLKTKNNLVVISPREKQIEDIIKNQQKQTEAKVVINGLRLLRPTPYYQRLKLRQKLKELGIEISLEELEKIYPSTTETPLEEKEPQKVEKKKNKKKKKKKSKKNKYKDKKGAKKMANRISENLIERTERNGNLLAELLKKADCLMIINNSLWIYNQKTGCFDSSDAENVATKLRMFLPEKDRMKVSTQEYKEAYNQLMISGELVSEESFLQINL